MARLAASLGLPASLMTRTFTLANPDMSSVGYSGCCWIFVVLIIVLDLDHGYYYFCMMDEWIWWLCSALET
jgi:hypothetical protein